MRGRGSPSRTAPGRSARPGAGTATVIDTAPTGTTLAPSAIASGPSAPVRADGFPGAAEEKPLIEVDFGRRSGAGRGSPAQQEPSSIKQSIIRWLEEQL
jgi:hypothetical protein